MQEQRHDRHDEVEQSRRRILRDRDIADDRQPFELQAEEQQEQQAEPEGRDRQQQRRGADQGRGRARCSAARPRSRRPARRSALAISTAMKTICALIQKRGPAPAAGPAGCDVIDWPRSPCRTLPNQIMNWIGRLWSRPSRCRRSARLAGSAISPSIRDAGSPGIRRIRTKTETAMMSRVGTAIRVRLIAKRNMVVPSLAFRPFVAARAPTLAACPVKPTSPRPCACRAVGPNASHDDRRIGGER